MHNAYFLSFLDNSWNGTGTEGFSLHFPFFPRDSNPGLHLLLPYSKANLDVSFREDVPQVMILLFIAWVSDKNYFQYTISIMFICPEQFLLPNIKQKSKLKCFLLLKKASSGAELGHALLSHWVSYYIV